jgi:negative regulator of sigma E activity
MVLTTAPMFFNATGSRRLLLAFALMLTARPASAADDAAELLRKAVDALPQVPFVATMRLSAPAGVRELQLSHKLVGGARASVLEVTAPDEVKGIQFLFIEHRDKPPEQYVKIPAVSRRLLATSEAATQPFLGSAFAVADLVTPDVAAFNYRFVGEETVLDRPCKLVESVPRHPGSALYAKAIYTLDPKDLLALKRQFLDHKGRLAKLWEVQRVAKINNLWTVMQQSMTDVQSKTTSSLEVVNLDFNVTLPDSMFDPGSLLKQNR